MKNVMKRLLNDSSGVTLVETLVALGIMGMALGLIGSGIFQSLSIEKFWLDDVVATREARHAGSWFSGDALNAEEVCYYDEDSNPQVMPLDDPDDPNDAKDHVILVWYDNILGDNTSLLPSPCSLAVSAGNYTITVATYTADTQFENQFLRILETDGVPTSQQVLSRRISDVAFTRTQSATGDVLRAVLKVEAERGTEDTLTLDTFLRRLR